MMRIRLRFVPGVDVEFVDRDVAIRQVGDFAERGTRFPLVVYGPEGCGKTALFRQAFEVLRERGYSVVYISPLEREARDRLIATDDFKPKLAVDKLARLLTRLTGAVGGEAPAALVEYALNLITWAIRRGKRRIAVLADDIFKAVGLDKAEIYVKILLNFIEYPSRPVEKIVVLVGSSEGETREKIGRHRWSHIVAMWNMPREGFKRLYDQLPGEKPPLEDMWRVTGGNPGYLAKLCEARWNVEVFISNFIRERKLRSFVDRLTPLQREVLAEAVEDPDVLRRRLREAEDKRPMVDLINRLVEENLIVDYLPSREPHGWIDEPPPVDRELGIGEFFAWQMPLHREAVRRALEAL
ncbi:ATP-binding protein [Infirmifilum lucidum]|uniref:ATP-binding protein n=1 Tax=Infirmifilum lucidum TaxID=2776706 RepID=A0A7L9FHK2_9CREN|nr:ATP-binding protein [Infirmifilum lucidum]QOJ79280.1 ATP-binding protein [Infirmifilum lucidum]